MKASKKRYAVSRTSPVAMVIRRLSSSKKGNLRNKKDHTFHVSKYNNNKNDNNNNNNINNYENNNNNNNDITILIAMTITIILQ